MSRAVLGGGIIPDFQAHEGIDKEAFPGVGAIVGEAAQRRWSIS